MAERKACTRCGRVKPAEGFQILRDGGRSPVCIQCRTERAGNHLTPRQVRQILARLGEGAPVKQVAQEFGVSEPTVYYQRQKAAKAAAKAAAGLHDRRFENPTAHCLTMPMSQQPRER